MHVRCEDPKLSLFGQPRRVWGRGAYRQDKLFIPFYNINLLIVFHTVLQDSESVGQEEDSEGVR
jgi:hypothetical protein